MSFCCTTSHLVPTPVSPWSCGCPGPDVSPSPGPLCTRHDVVAPPDNPPPPPPPAPPCLFLLKPLALHPEQIQYRVDPRYLRRLLSVLSHIWRPKQEAVIQWVLLHKQQTMPGMEIKSSRQNSRGCQKAVSSLSRVKDCPGSPGYLGVDI